MSSDNPLHGESFGSLIPSGDFAHSRPIASQLGAPAAGEPASTIGPKSILHAVRRRWKFAMPIGLLLSAILGTAGWVLLVPKYTAAAYLRLNADERPLVFQTADQVKSDFKLYKNTQAQLMKTPFVLNAAMRDPKVASLKELKEQEDPLSFIQKEVSISYPGDGELLQVSFSSPDAQTAIDIVNAIVDAYLNEVVESEKKERKTRLDSLDTVYLEAEEKVRNRRSELKNMAVALGTGDSESLTVAQQSALQQFGQMQQKLSEIQFELMQSEGQLRVANELAERYAKAQEERSSKELEQEKVDMEAAINTMVDRSPDVARLRDEVDMLQGKVLAMSQSYGSAFPAYKIAKQDLDYKQKLLDDRREKARSSATEEVERAQEEGDRMRQRQEVDSQSRDMFANRSYDSIGLATRVEVLRNQEKLLVAKVDQLSNETRQLGRSSIDIELLRSEIKGLEDVLQRVGGEIERTSIELKTASRVRPISPASTATRPDFSKRITRSAALSLFGLFAPLMLLVGWDLSHRRIDSSESMSSALSIPTLGSIPKVSQRVLFRSPPAGHRLEAERVRVIESIDSIGSMVQFLARNDGSKVFLITSAIPSEGKSTIACQLADSLARSGNRVMLVDLDLRRPSIHRYLKLANDVGVTDVLEGRCQVSQAIQTTANDRMSILTAGTENENIQVLCTNGSVERMVAKLRDEYDFVIIDSCPILPVADTRSLVKFCDSVILTLVRDHSRLPLVSEAAAILRTYRARIIGGVIIGVGSIGYAKHYYSKSHNRPALETQSVSDESDAFAETK